MKVWKHVFIVAFSQPNIEMPYKLRKAPLRDLYWVIAEDGRHMSKDPLPRERAVAQMRALYRATRRETR